MSGDTDYHEKKTNKDFKKEILCLDGVISKHTSHKPANLNGLCYIMSTKELKDNLIDLGLTCETSEVDDLDFLPEDHGLD